MKCFFKNKFLDCVLTEGIIALALGILMLLIPQLTSIATAMVFAIAIATYGIFKILNSISSRKTIKHVWFNVLLGVWLLLLGWYLAVSPIINLLFMTLILGIYFLLESIRTISYTVQTRGILKYWWLNFFIAILQFIISFIILAGLQVNALWILGIVFGVNFLFYGISMISIFLSTLYIEDNCSTVV